MTRSIKIVAWLCIFSILFMGCYSSALIDPRGEEGQRICSGDIESVVTKDGTEYRFDKPPTIVNEAIVIKSTGDEQTRIYTNEIMSVITKDGKKHIVEKPPAIVNDTIVISPARAEKDRIYSNEISFVITKDGTKYMFVEPPMVINDNIVGELKAHAPVGFADDPTGWVTAAKGTQVSIPLYDVAKVSVSEFSIEWTIGTAVGIVLVLLGIGLALSTATIPHL